MQKLNLHGHVKIGNVILSSFSKPKIAVNVAGEGVLQSAKLAENAGADILEVRCDLFEKFDLDQIEQIFIELKRITKLPVLVTMRKTWVSHEGVSYSFEGSEEDRLKLFTRIMRYVNAVDIELDSEIRDKVLEKAKKHKKPAIVSYHNFECTESLEKLKEIAKKAYDTSGSVIKISVMANDRKDVVTALRLLIDYVEDKNYSHKPIIVISMGNVGKISRIAFPFFGSCLGYAHLDEASNKAPGQIDINELRRF